MAISNSAMLTPSRVPVGYPQGWPAGVARWKVIGQVPTRMVMLQVRELLADLLNGQDRQIVWQSQSHRSGFSGVGAG
jgi:hypothetical protein